MNGLEYLSRSVLAVPLVPAGEGFTVPVPESERWLVLAVCLTLATDATAGNRNVVVELVDGAGTVVCQTVSGYALTPSSSARFSFARGSSEWDSDLATQASGPLFDVPCDAVDKVVVTVSGAGAADAITDGRVTVLQVPVRPELDRDEAA